MTDVRDTVPPPKPGMPQPGSGLDADVGETEPDPSNEPLPIPGDDPEVGLSQKGSDEDAIIRRETEI